MKACLLHIYGPICIQSWGLSIALGLLVFMYFLQRDKRFVQLHLEDRWYELLSLGIIAGLIGGRLLYVLTYGDMSHIIEFFYLWQGGFSILGAILALIVTLPLYVYIHKIAILPLLDLVALYSPLLQSISRIGCFLAGCCYGIEATVPWTITYTDTESFAPLHCALHPTQLYSSILLMIIFLVLYFIVEPLCKKPGQVTCFYLMGVSFERFIVDFWRADRIFNSLSSVLSINQLIALGIFTGSIIGLSLIEIYSKRHQQIT